MPSSNLLSQSVATATQAGLYQAGSAPGVASGVAATAGAVGEVITSQSTTPINTAASIVTGNLTSISLTAGSWLVRGGASPALHTGTSVEIFQLGLTTTSLGNTTIPGKDMVNVDAGFVNFQVALSMTGLVVNVSSTTTYYLTGYSKYGGGQTRWNAYFIEAVRIR